MIQVIDDPVGNLDFRNIKDKHILNILNLLANWQMVCVGRYKLKLTTIAMAMGINIRTGLEDTLYYKKAEIVKNNAHSVARMVRLTKELGKEPATIDEAKEMLGLK